MTSTADLQVMATAAAKANGVPTNMFLWQMGQESSWNPNAQNPAPGSTSGGIAGFIDKTANALGINKYDPAQALNAAAKLDAQEYAATGNWKDALTQYGTLANVSPKVMDSFNNALASDNANSPQTSNNFIGEVWTGLQNFGGNIIQNGPFALNPFLAPAAKATVEAVTTNPLVKNGAFIVLGIVLITVAVLSNDTVRGAAIKAVK